jgi:cell division protein FtsB
MQPAPRGAGAAKRRLESARTARPSGGPFAFEILGARPTICYLRRRRSWKSAASKEGSVPDLIRRLEHPGWSRGRPPGASPRTWAIRLGFAALGAWLVYSFVFSDQGILRILAMRREAAKLEARSRMMAANVKQVDAELQRVHKDPIYTEMYLRENMGMVRPGELVIRVVNEAKAQQAIDAQAQVPPPLPRGPRGRPPGSAKAPTR